MASSGWRVFWIVMLLLVVGGMIAVGVAAISMLGGGGKVPSETIVEVDLTQGMVEYMPVEPIADALFGKRPTLRESIEAIRQAADDDRVVAIVARVGAAPLGLARVQELRQAVTAFRESGKRAVAWTDTLGEVGPANGGYYLASAFEELWLQPSGDIGLTGLVYESPFIRGSLDKLGVEPRMDHRYEYKAAKNLFTETEYTAAQEEAMRVLMESQFEQMIAGIAESREMSPEEVRAVIDRGPFYGQEAVDAGLVDGLAYRDEVYASLDEEFGEEIEKISLVKYGREADGLYDSGRTVALIYGVGTVTRGKSDADPLTGSVNMGSDTVTEALRAAIDDDDVEGILFRVDSPGGSYVASDSIWRETVRAKEAGKPVIISMGDVAASGGYYVAMEADKIVAQPGTITGSIGVLGGKLLTSGFWEKLGITWDEVHSSANSSMWSGRMDYTEEGWARFQDWLDRVYDDFTSKAAAGRGMEVEELRKIAKGRIWTGADAKEIGLVDELGGFHEAVALTREAIGAEADEAIHLKLYPRPKTRWQILMEAREGGEAATTVRLIARVMETLRPLIKVAQEAGLLEGARGELQIPDPPPVN